VEEILRVRWPEATLRRGYSITTDAAGKVIQSVNAARPKSKIKTRVADGNSSHKFCRAEGARFDQAGSLYASLLTEILTALSRQDFRRLRAGATPLYRRIYRRARTTRGVTVFYGDRAPSLQHNDQRRPPSEND
jgi:hypothetical protein